MNQLTFDFNSSSPTKGEPENIDKLLDLLCDLKKFRVDIEKALWYGGNAHNFDSVVTGVLQGKFHFYPLLNSCVICEVVAYPNYKAYHGFIAAGELEEIQQFVDTIGQDNAKRFGCSKITMVGRHGWVRAMKPYGWKHTLSTLEKDIT